MVASPFYESDAKCAKDVDAMMQLLEDLGPEKAKQQRSTGDDGTNNTETSTVNESFESGSDAQSDVSSDSHNDNNNNNDNHKTEEREEGAEEEEEEEGAKDELAEEEMELEFIHLKLRANDIPDKAQLQQCSNEELLELLERMRAHLTQSLADLTAEKVIRRSKEKSLEKLAKELCKRVREGEMQDNQIRSLNCSLKKTAEALAELQKAEQKLKTECEALKDEQEATKREHKAKMDAQVAEYTKELDGLRASYNDELQNGRQLQEFVDNIEGKYDYTIRMFKMRNALFFLSAVIGFSIVVGYIERPEVIMAKIQVRARRAREFTRDYMCAPVPPGFSLPAEVATFDAPWWAPLGTKEAAFEVCGDRTRARMHWDWINNKLSMYELREKDKSSRIWALRIHDADVSRDKILIKSRRGRVVRKLNAPWSM